MSSPFQKQFSSKNPMSPLNGAYASGADAMVTVSDAGHFAKLQSDITNATSDAMDPKLSKCEQGAEYYFDKDGAKFICPKKLSVKDTKKALKKIGASTTDNEKDPYNLTAKMEKNTGLTNKQSIEQRVGEGLSNRFNIGNIYQ